MKKDTGCEGGPGKAALGWCGRVREDQAHGAGESIAGSGKSTRKGPGVGMRWDLSGWDRGGEGGGGGRQRGESCSGSQNTGTTRHILERSQEVTAGVYIQARVCNVPFVLNEQPG